MPFHPLVIRWLPGNVQARTQWSTAGPVLVMVTSTVAPAPQSSRSWYRTSQVAAAACAAGRESNGALNAPAVTTAAANATQRDDLARLVSFMKTPRSILVRQKGVRRGSAGAPGCRRQ